jgi:1-acyl-sn-glycerol-3-phosphate acyltransferase
VSSRAVLPLSFLLRAGRVKRWREGRGRAFYPPLTNGLAVGISWRFLSGILWRAARVREVSVVGLERLASLKGQRAVVTPNHPTDMDPLALFELSRQAEEPFHYLASRESFSVPFFGWLLQLCGAYSILRGVVDRAAIKTTRSLLVAGKKIVMFPEGLTYGQNDTLMPFHEGVAQFGFWALEDLSGAGPLWYVPVGLRYRFMKPMGEEIEQALERLEEHTGVTPGGKSRYERLRAIGEKVVAGYEAAYHVRPSPGDTLDVRIDRMKDVWVSRAAGAIGVRDDPSLPLGDRIRAVVNGLDRMVIAEDASAFTKRTMRRRHEETMPLYRDLERAGRFLATGARYIADHPSDERYLEVISRIEEELFGITQPLGPRRAEMVVGEPIDIAGMYQEYKHDPRGTVTALTCKLEEEVRGLLSGRDTEMP